MNLFQRMVTFILNQLTSSVSFMYFMKNAVEWNVATGLSDLRPAAESTLPKYNYCKTMNDPTLAKWLNYGIWDMVVLEARKRGVSVSQTQWWSLKNIKYQVLGNSKCEDFPKPRWGRKLQRTTCARRSGAEKCWGTGLNERVYPDQKYSWFWVFVPCQRTLQTGICARMFCRKTSRAKSLPHNSMSKTGSPPLGDKLPSLSNLVLNSLQAELELGRIEWMLFYPKLSYYLLQARTPFSGSKLVNTGLLLIKIKIITAFSHFPDFFFLVVLHF